ncbi:MAG: acyl-CoA thioesterase [Candidatus Nanopelagicales bacterium]
MTTFRELTSAAAGTWRRPEGWEQGRGAWGGLLVGTAVRAAEEADPRPGETDSHRSVREVSVDMLGPVPAGDVPVRVSALRQGSGTSAWRVEFLGEDEVLATASVVLGQPRSGDQPTIEQLTRPEAPAWNDVPLVALGPPLAPVFTQHLEFRPVAGFPYQGRIEDVVCWVRFPQPDPVDAALLLGMVDALWPATLVSFSEPRPMATLTFAASLLVDPSEVDPEQPLLHCGRLLAARDGYATEVRELWTPDGRLAVVNTQVMAIIR